MKRNSMLWKVLLAIVLAIFIGNFTGKTAAIFGITFYQIFDLVGQLFLNALTVLVVPLISASIISGLGQMSHERSFKSLGFKTFAFYIMTIALAVFLGVCMAYFFQPGKSYQPIATDMVFTTTTNSSAFSQVLLKLIPNNVIEAAAQGNMLGIIFFSILFGFAMMRLEPPLHSVLLSFWKALFNTLMRITHFVIKTMPIGVFCLVAKAVAVQGLHNMGNLLYFFFTVLGGLLIFALVLLPILLRLFGLDPIQHIRSVFPALVTAFSTSSSTATLPITMECIEKRAGVSNRVCSFVIPLGTSMNMAGSALYECVAVLFIAQVYGIELSFLNQLAVAFLALITSMGVAGIPSASLVAIIIILQSMGLPAEALAIILPVDRLLDMCRTTTNVFSDTTCAVLVAHTEGERVLQEELSS